MIYILSYILDNNKIYYMILNIINTVWKTIQIKSIDWIECNLNIEKGEIDNLIEQSDRYLIIDEKLDDSQIKTLFKLLLTNKIDIKNDSDIIKKIFTISDDNIIGNRKEEPDIDESSKNDEDDEDDEDIKSLEKLFKPCSPRLRGVLLKVFYELNL